MTSISLNTVVLKKLPGDVVLADRGFDIAESVAMMQVQLHIPAFTKGKQQLSAEEVEAPENSQCENPRGACHWMC